MSSAIKSLCYFLIFLQLSQSQDFFDTIDDVTDDDSDYTKVVISQMNTPGTIPAMKSPAMSFGQQTKVPKIQPQNTEVTLARINEAMSSSTTVPSEFCSKKSVKGSGDYQPFPGSCNQYLHCDKSQQAFLETCAAGTFFDGSRCARAEDVFCPWDPCMNFATGHKYSDGQTCYGFFTCNKGHSSGGVCPDGFAFNNLKVGCLPDPTCNQPSGVLNPCFEGTTLPFPGQPHMFYLWDGRKQITPMICPKGLWYNPHICSCDWIFPGKTMHRICKPMFHFGYNGNFLEEYNQAPQQPNTAISLYHKSALFDKGGQIVIWMMNNIDLDSEWALCFEFMTQVHKGEVALLSNDWKTSPFTYKLTYIPSKGMVKGYFKLKNGIVSELAIMGVASQFPHFLRLARQGSLLIMRVDNLKPVGIDASAGLVPNKNPLVVGAASGCNGFVGFFDELKFFRCIPDYFFDDYKK